MVKDERCDAINVTNIGTIQDYGTTVAFSQLTGIIVSVSADADAYPWINSDAYKSFGNKEIKYTTMFNRYASTSIDAIVLACRTCKRTLWHTINKSDSVTQGQADTQGQSATPAEGVNVHVSLPDTDLVVVSMVDTHACVPRKIDKLPTVNDMITDDQDQRLQFDCCANLRKCFGYDRGLVYKFLDDFTGEVIYEDTCTDIAYLGLRFPSGDIPKQARAHYIRERVRFIGDTAKPQKGIIGQNIDLSDHPIRGVAAQHVDYLHNMGVRASMSIALLENGALWGLMCFHSWKEPRIPSPLHIDFLLTISDILSNNLSLALRRETLNRRISLTTTLDTILDFEGTACFLRHHANDLLPVFRCCTICFKDVDYDTMDVIGDDNMKTNVMDVFDSEPMISYGELRNPSRSYCLINHSMCKVILIRVNNVHDVNWAGDPAEFHEGDGAASAPFSRKTFTRFVKAANAITKRWTEEDRSLIKMFAEHMNTFLQRRTIAAYKERIEQAHREREATIIHNREDQRFFAQMSHELRTPFHGVMSVLRILQDQTLSTEETAEYVSMAIECGDSMIHTLDNILNISKRTSAGSISEKKQEVITVAVFIKTSMDVLQSLSRSKGVSIFLDEFRSDGGETIESVVTYPILLRQIVTNIVGNAIKFTPARGSVNVSYKVHTCLEDTFAHCHNKSSMYRHSYSPNALHTGGRDDTHMPHLSLCVQDTGCGMALHSLKKIFEPYTQVSGVGNGIGTGLGLHICLVNVMMLRGSMSVASTPALGTCFYFTIPVDIGSTSRILEDVTDNEAVVKVEENCVFIVVDDNRVNMKLATKQIKWFVKDATVLTAEDGQQGFQLVQRMTTQGEHITGVFMDYHMPVLDGAESIKLIRAMEADVAATPMYIAAFTADIIGASTEILQNAGATNVLGKPIKKSELREAIMSMIAHAKNARDCR
ncbi:unnamed protein product [Ectocarpus sp. 6 AP-2014]